MSHNKNKTSQIPTILSAALFCSVFSAGVFLVPQDVNAGFVDWAKNLFSSKKSSVLFDVRTAVHQIKLGSDEKGNYVELTDLQAATTENDRPSKQVAAEKFATAFKTMKSSGSMVFSFCVEGTDRCATFPGVMEQSDTLGTYRVYLTENANKISQLQSLKKVEEYLAANPKGIAFFNALALKANQEDFCLFASGGCFVGKLDATHWRVVFKGVDEVRVIGSTGLKDTLLTSEFKEKVWSKTFETTPPNVAFTALNSDGSRALFSMKLSKPSFDPATQQLSFEGIFLEDDKTIDIPNALKTTDSFETFSPVWVMVDSSGGGW